MKTKSFLIIFLLFFFLPIQVFASTNSYQEYTSQMPWSYEVYKTSNDYLTIISKNNQGNTGNSNTGKIVYDIKLGSLGRFFRYPTDTEDYVLKKGSVNLGFIFNCNQYSKYCGITSNFEKYTTTELDGNTKCEITSLNFDNENYKIEINSNLLPLKAGSNYIFYEGEQIHKISSNPIEHLLKKYYYMKTEVKAELYNSNNQKVSGVDTKIFGSGSYYDRKYVLIKPDLNTIDFNLPDEKSLGLKPGKYFWKITATPIDLKCDFNKKRSLENNERTIATYSLEEFEIDPCKIDRDNTDGRENYKYKVGSDKVQIEYKIDNVKKKINYKLDEDKKELLTSDLIMSLMPDDYFVKRGFSGKQNINYSMNVKGCTNTATDNFDYYFLDLNLDLPREIILNL